MGRQADISFGALFKKKATKLRTKVNTRIYMYNSSYIKIGQEKQALYININIHF